MIFAAFALLVGLIAPVHAGPPQAAPPIAVQPTAPDVQPATVIRVYLVANRALGPPSGAFFFVVLWGHPYSAAVNWYAYCGGDPVNWSDPSGLDRVSAARQFSFSGELRPWASGRVTYAMTSGGFWTGRSDVASADIGSIQPGAGEAIDQRIEINVEHGGGTVSYGLLREVAAEIDRGNGLGANALPHVIKDVIDEAKTRERQGAAATPLLDEQVNVIMQEARREGDSLPLALYKAAGHTAYYMLPVVGSATTAISGEMVVIDRYGIAGVADLSPTQRRNAGLSATAEALSFGLGGGGGGTNVGMRGARFTTFRAPGEFAHGAALVPVGRNVAPVVPLGARVNLSPLSAGLADVQPGLTSSTQLFGPYYRTVGFEAVDEMMLLGRPMRNIYASDIPAAKAINSALPSGQVGYDFYTLTPHHGYVPPGDRPTGISDRLGFLCAFSMAMTGQLYQLSR